MRNANTTVRDRNDERVYAALKELGFPSSITRIHLTVGEISERTVRRAVASLVKNGFVVETGRAAGSSSVLYSVTESASTETGKLIPLESGFVTVEDFMRVMSSMTTDPFRSNTKTEVFSEKIKMAIRKRMLFVIITASEPGFKGQLNTVQESLIRIEEEMERMLNLLRNFNNSPVWFDQFRDQMALGVREAQKNDAELYQLCQDIVKGE